MQDDPSTKDPVENEIHTASAQVAGNSALPLCENDPQTPAPPVEGPVQSETGEADPGNTKPPEKEQPAATPEPKEKMVSAVLRNSQAEIVSAIGGNKNRVHFGAVYKSSQGSVTNTIDGYGNEVRIGDTNNYGIPGDKKKSLSQLVEISPLQPPSQIYKSVDSSKSAGYMGALLSHRILVLSCYDDEVGTSIAKSIAYANKSASKHLVTVQKECQGAYSIKDVIEHLARLQENGDKTQPAIWLWWANEVSDGDLSDTILDSLFGASVWIEHCQAQLGNCSSYLICLVPPQKIQGTQHARFEAHLQNWNEDFLRPLLEEHGLSDYDELAETITRQREDGLWSENHNEFYKEIRGCLREHNLSKVVADRPERGYKNSSDAQQLFDRQDPLVNTVLYCATYFQDLSPLDFSYLVELLLGDATEEVTRKLELTQTSKEKEIVDVVENVPLVRRWRRDIDAVLRICKLGASRNDNKNRIVDFQVDGFKSSLSQYIQNDHYFFYDSSFQLVRRRGLLFSSRKEIAEGARQLLVEMAKQYASIDVANWVYEIVDEFETMMRGCNDLPDARPPLFSLLPAGKVKTARHLVAQGLSLALIRLNKEPELTEAVRLFWQRLLQTRHQWFLDLLRRMGNFAPDETLPWLKQLLNQGAPEIRTQVGDYLVGNLLRRGSLICPALKEIMDWPGTTMAGHYAQKSVIVYFAETNRLLAQEDYGRWPSTHPLFGFHSRNEAIESLDLLLDWLFAAAPMASPEDGQYVIADILAGWYFILFPQSQVESTEAAPEATNNTELDATIVRELLLERLARYVSRQQKHGLLTIWESFKDGILQQIFQLDEFANQLVELLFDATMLKDAKSARRKLLDTRALLSQLRKDFIHWTVEVNQASGATNEELN